ncbi:PspC domain-containing protein [Ligilactobacillus cholophilus]|uniref:PspC domain-containing protein n=1 Tax=Ligilactobacillus cholophilus TaxID=3050131 RepID=UPI0025B016AB|nr:PspC domain-containing protein [Ligilactobacillus cholophilus]
MSKKKRLTKSADKVVCGVFGGIAEYFGWDKAITRIVGAFLIIFPGTIFAGTLLYFIAAMVMPSPDKPDIIEGDFKEK